MNAAVAGSAVPRGVGGQGYPRPVLFSITTRPEGEWSVVTLVGELDLAAAPRVRGEVHRLVTAGRLLIVLDLAGVDFMDSTGLGVLVGALKRVRANGGDLRIATADTRLLSVFEMTGLDAALPLHADVASAIAAGRHEGEG